MRRYRKTTDDDFAAAAAAREEGLSLQEIADRLNLPKSTVGYLLRRAELSPAGRARVQAMHAQRAAESAARAALVRQVARAWAPDDDHREALRAAARETLLRWREDELPLRRAVELVLGAALIKAWLPTAAGDVVVRVVVGVPALVEWARTPSSVYRIVERLPLLPPERRRVIWVPDVDSAPAERMRAAGAEVHGLDELRLEA